MSNLPSGLSDVVAENEELARFLTQSNQFNNQFVKPSAFLPSPKDRETSVFRCSQKPKEELRELGRAAAGERTLYGAAIFSARAVKSAQLEVIADEPPLCHAAIRGWPWDENDPVSQKAKQKEIALTIASNARLSLF